MKTKEYYRMRVEKYIKCLFSAIQKLSMQIAKRISKDGRKQQDIYVVVVSYYVDASRDLQIAKLSSLAERTRITLLAS